MKKLVPGFALLAGILLTHNVSFAQREAPTREDRREQRRQENANLTPEQRRQNFEARFQERLKSATPEQRERMLQQRAEFQARMQERMKEAGIDPNDPQAWDKMRQAGGFEGMGQGRGNRERMEQMRQAMIAAGITQKETQDPVLEFILQQERQRRSVLQLARETAGALMTPLAQPVADGEAQPEAATPQVVTPEIGAKFEAYLAAMEAEKTRYAKELASLDEKVGYSENPRLKAFLTLVGILNTDAFALGGPTEIFQPAQTEGEGGPRQAQREGRQRNGNAARDGDAAPNNNAAPNNDAAQTPPAGGEGE